MSLKFKEKDVCGLSVICYTTISFQVLFSPFQLFGSFEIEKLLSMTVFEDVSYICGCCNPFVRVRGLQCSSVFNFVQENLLSPGLERFWIVVKQERISIWLANVVLHICIESLHMCFLEWPSQVPEVF